MIAIETVELVLRQQAGKYIKGTETYELLIGLADGLKNIQLDRMAEHVSKRPQALHTLREEQAK